MKLETSYTGYGDKRDKDGVVNCLQCDDTGKIGKYCLSPRALSLPPPPRPPAERFRNFPKLDKCSRLTMASTIKARGGDKQACVHDVVDCSEILHVFQPHGNVEVDMARLYSGSSSEAYPGLLN